MFTKKAAKQLKKLPASVRGAAVRAIETNQHAAPLTRNKSLGSVKLGMKYRMLVDQVSGEVTWIGTHNDYNSYIMRRL